MSWYADIENSILRILRQVVRDLKRVETSQTSLGKKVTALQNTVTEISDKVDRANATLDKIVSYLIPPPPVKFIVTITADQNLQGDKTMPVKKATVDFQLLDNGTATLTATPVDSVGLPTSAAGASPATWVSNNPGLIVTVNPADPTGFTATVSPATPPVLLTGAVCTISCLLADGTTTITGNSDPIDVIAGGPAGFSVIETPSV